MIVLNYSYRTRSISPLLRFGVRRIPAAGFGTAAALGSVALRYDLRRPGITTANADIRWGIIQRKDGNGMRLERRAFQTSARREAAAPAMLAIAVGVLKSSALLACFTEFSRLFLTFLPLSTAMKYKMAKKLRLHNHTDPADVTSEDVKKFYEWYCEGEGVWGKDQQLGDLWTKEEKTNFWKRQWWNRDPHTNAGEGRKKNARLVLERTVHVSKQRTLLPPTFTEEDALPMKYFKGPWLEFVVLPELSPAAISSLQSFTLEQRQELYVLRNFKARQQQYQKKYHVLSNIMMAVILLPLGTLGLSVLLSLERTPYTGRWRSIMLSPNEEDALSAQLRGAGWYKTVITQLTTPESPAPSIVPQGDWRWAWVNSTLRSLESGMVAECDRNKRASESPSAAKEIDQERHAIFTYDSGLIPPPPAYPLQPRARPSAQIHEASADGGQRGTGQGHLAFGPPYSLLLMENEERNALSYGFGQDGAGGIVIFTGILDEILASGNGNAPRLDDLQDAADTNNTSSTPKSTSILASLFGLNAYSPPPPPPATPQPTPEQTMQLASVLAHELAHLALSHHLESMSAMNVLIPNALNLTGDVVRTIIFPVTAMLGPHVHDIISDWTKFGIDETKAMSDVAFSRTQEREADVVGLRILAYAGYDPADCLAFWTQTPTPACSPDKFERNAADTKSNGDRFMWTYLRGRTHDSDEQRQELLKAELDRWRRLHQHV